MKILQVISSFPPAYAYGGALKTAYELSKHLIMNGHEVTVYTTDAYDVNSRLNIEENPIWMEGIEVYRFKNISNGLSYKNFPIAPSMASALKNNIAKFDIIHLHEFRSFQAILVHYHSKKNKIPYIVQPHGSAVNIMGMFLGKKIFDVIWGNSILKDSSKVVALTIQEKDHFRKLNIKDSNIEIIPNGITLSDYENLPEEGIFKRKYNINPNKKIILFLGRLHKIKGIDLLIKSFSELSKDNNHIRLVIAGPDGGFLSEIIDMTKKLGIQNKVIITGPLYGLEKLEAFVDSDIYVLPSIYETFPNSVLEALACGKSVIVTKNCGIAEIIENTNSGIVVSHDKDDLKLGILEILENEELNREFNLNGRKMITELFEWEKVLKEFENLFKNVTNTK